MTPVDTCELDWFDPVTVFVVASVLLGLAASVLWALLATRDMRKMF